MIRDFSLMMMVRNMSHMEKTKIYLTRLKDDGTGVLDPNDEGTLIITAPKGYEYLFEGCHTYKRNGWYYIFNPALGTRGTDD